MSNIYFIRQTPFVLLTRLVVLEFIFVVLYLLFRLPKFILPDAVTQDIFFSWSFISIFFFGLLSTFQLIGTVFVTMAWTNEYYVIRTSDILHRKGVLSLKEETFSLKNIEAFTVDQSLIGKIFNFGSIKFYSPVLKQDYYLTNIPNPERLKESIEQTKNMIQTNLVKGKNEFIIPLRNR